MDQLVSVIISTRNRPNQLLRCLESIFLSTYSTYEVIILDQSDEYPTQDVLISLCRHPTVRYFKMYSCGLSRARNYGIKIARGSIVAFTDDDCIVSCDWLSSIIELFYSYSSVAGVFGATYPYKKGKKGYICPCTYSPKSTVLITEPCYHDQVIGYGNNMAFRRNILNEVGGFREWLGVGSVGLSAEDADMAERVLLEGHSLLSSASMIVYHDRWLSINEHEALMARYTVGEIACYGYFFWSGQIFAQKAVANSIRNICFELKNNVRSCQSIGCILYTCKVFIIRITAYTYGLFLSLLFYIRYRYFKHPNS